MEIVCYLGAFILISALIRWFLTKSFNHWKNQNVPSISNPVPGFGHMLPVIFFKQNMSSLMHKMYKETTASMIGFYFLKRPCILIRDPELSRIVLSTNFMNFHNNMSRVSEKVDPVMSKNPFFTEDYHLWKVTRARTTAHFSGRKLRLIFAIAQEVCDKMSAYTDRRIKENSDGSFECETKSFFAKFTGELVANAAFAVQGQNFEDQPDKMAFANVAKTIFSPSLINGIKQALRNYLPSVADFFEITLLQRNAENYFKRTAKEIIKQRKQTGDRPGDYLQFCIDYNGEDLDSIVADLIIFYSDVYETSSSSMASIFYFVSKDINVQRKLREEIVKTIESTDGKLTYESLKSMNYLEQVIQESLRLLVPLGVSRKVCTKEITLRGSDGLNCHLKPGDPVFISRFGLNLDSQYWPNPEVFDPERFTPENIAKRHKYVFLPFGEGPRMCVGMRFGMMLLKLVVSHMLTQYSVEYSSRTKEPLELEATTLLTHVKGGLWVKFKKL